MFWGHSVTRRSIRFRYAYVAVEYANDLLISIKLCDLENIKSMRVSYWEQKSSKVASSYGCVLTQIGKNIVLKH